MKSNKGLVTINVMMYLSILAIFILGMIDISINTCELVNISNIKADEFSIKNNKIGEGLFNFKANLEKDGNVNLEYLKDGYDDRAGTKITFDDANNLLIANVIIKEGKGYTERFSYLVDDFDSDGDLDIKFKKE